MLMFATALIQAPWVPWSLYIMINFAQTIARGPPSSLQTQWYIIFSLVCLLNEYQHEHEHSGSSVGRVWDFFVCFLLIAQWLQHKPWQINLFSTKTTNFFLDMFVWSNTAVQYDPPTWRWVKILRIELGWARLCTLTLGYTHHPKWALTTAGEKWFMICVEKNGQYAGGGEAGLWNRLCGRGRRRIGLRAGLTTLVSGQ